MKAMTLFLLVALFSVDCHAQSSLTDQLKGLLDSNKDESRTENDTGLTENQMTAGFREALNEGVKFAVSRLGVNDGFLADERVRISVPESLEPLAKAARKLGQDRYIDALETTLNRAAEKAVPVTMDVFSDAIEQLSMNDAISILRGPDDAATQYFRNSSGDALRTAIRPLVSDATEQAGVTRAYKQLRKRGGGMLSSLMGDEDADLDVYVTNQAMDALFLYIAEQERQIRTDPVARTTDLLKSLFAQ